MTIEAIRSRLEARAIDAATQFEEKRVKNRETYPELAVWIDDMVRVFGHLPRGRFTTPTGVIEWGK